MASRSIRRSAKLLAPIMLLLMLMSGLGTVYAYSSSASGSNPGVLQVAPYRTVDVAHLAGVSAQIPSHFISSAPSKETGVPGTGPEISPQMTIAKSIRGINFTESTCSCLPPDGAVAAGPTRVIEMVNTADRIWDKTTLAIINTTTLNTFYGTTFGLADPRVIYDAASGHFFSSVDAFGNNLVLLGVSSTNDPNGKWTFYSVPSCLCTGNSVGDYPYLGVTSDKVTISVNAFSNQDGANVIVMNKANLIAGGVVSFSEIFLGTAPTFWSVIPVVSLSSVTTQYLVGEKNWISGPTSKLQLFKLTGVPGASGVKVTETDVKIPHAITAPPAADQPGSPASITTNDQRPLSAQYMKGKIWLTFNDGCIPKGDSVVRPCAGFVQLSNLTSATPGVAQDFNAGAIGTGYFFPSVAMTSKGAVFVFDTSSSTQYASFVVSGHANSAAPNTWQSPVVVFAGASTDPFGFRWGDYNAAEVDPSSPSMAWVEGEYSPLNAGSAIWGTGIALVGL